MESTIKKIKVYVSTQGEKFEPAGFPIRLYRMPHDWEHMNKVRIKEHITHHLYRDSDGLLYMVHCPVNSQWQYYCRVKRIF